MMNKHLELVFLLLLPELEKRGIEYWVFGGISVAGVPSKFHRRNKDVDIFVEDAEFKDARSTLESVCQNQVFKYRTKIDSETARPKFEVFDSNGKEVFSMIPIYQKDTCIILRYPIQYGGDQEFSVGLLDREERNVSGYRFFTPRNEYVKELFIKHMKTRPKKKLMMRSRFRMDAELLLSPSEIKEIENYYSTNC